MKTGGSLTATAVRQRGRHAAFEKVHHFFSLANFLDLDFGVVVADKVNQRIAFVVIIYFGLAES
tara:strand:+ start:414 stop:605 length:192 start_codon:yes stop_codon:yes gene_type:complete